MENKKVLGKIIPAALVLVLAILLVITISSCSKGKNTPVGQIEDKKDYLKIDIADDKAYSVSKLEFYNKLRYVGYDVFEDALYEAALNDIVKDIKDDIANNSADLTQATYYKRFKYVIDNDVYGKTDEKEIEDLEDKEKAKMVKSYLNKVKQNGYDVDATDNIYQLASFEYQTIKLAKREFARKKLLEEIDDEDSENRLTTKKIENYFTDNLHNRGSFSALIVLFSSQAEIEDTLRQLNLKFIGNKLYRVDANNVRYAAEGADIDPSKRTLAEYIEYYNDFDTTKSDGALSDNEVLFELCRVYNYVYSYRQRITFVVDGVDYLDDTTYAVNPLTNSNYSRDDQENIYKVELNDMIEMLVAQDNGNLDESPRINYDYDTIHGIDSTLSTAMYTKYLANSSKVDRYNTPTATFGRGNYLSFKLTDSKEASYKELVDLCNLVTSVENGDDEKTISANLETVKESYANTLKALGIYTDDEKTLAWALDFAENLVLSDIKGAKNILKSTEEKNDEDSIWSKVFETMLTDEYISEKLKEYLDDECKITIYDSLFEAQFAQNNYEIFKISHNKSKENVLKIKFTDKENPKEDAVITAEDMFNRLEKRHGAGVASNLLFNQILKEKYYDDVITNEKKKEYEKEYENVLTYFAQGQSSQYGYDASIGQKAFINLYFQADSKEEAIFNMWVSRELQNTLIYKNPTDFNSNVLDYFTTLTNLQKETYVNIEYNLVYVYTDDDEDGEPDDWTLVDDSDERKQEVMALSAELLNIFNERAMNEFSNTSRDGAYNSLHTKYQSASRISTIGYAGEDPVPTDGFKTTSEQDAYYFAKFKSKGIFMNLVVSKAINTISALNELDDDSYIAQVQAMYNYMLRTHSSDLKEEVIIARTMTADDEGANLDIATAENVFLYKKGFASFYVYKCAEANTFRFEEKDNADTSTGGKVYPYSKDENDPYPVDEETGKPYDNTGEPDSLYNTEDTVSINQLIVYIRENKDGVESLSTDVINAFNDYFDEYIMQKYKSEAFIFYIAQTLIEEYEAAGKITIDQDLRKRIDTIVACQQESLFSYEENAFTAKWYELFN